MSCYNATMLQYCFSLVTRWFSCSRTPMLLKRVSWNLYTWHSDHVISYYNYYTLLGFLELVNNMLTSGMVPALFPDDEKEALIGQVKRPLKYCLEIMLTLYMYLSLSPPNPQGSRGGHQGRLPPVQGECVVVLCPKVCQQPPHCAVHVSSGRDTQDAL